MSSDSIIIPFLDDEGAIACSLEFSKLAYGGVKIVQLEDRKAIFEWVIPNKPPGFFKRFEGDRTSQDTLLRFSRIARESALLSVQAKNKANWKRRHKEFVKRVNHLSLSDAVDLIVEKFTRGNK